MRFPNATQKHRDLNISPIRVHFSIVVVREFRDPRRLDNGASTPGVS